MSKPAKSKISRTFSAQPATKVAKLERKGFEKALGKFHVELVKLQDWVKHKGLKVIVVFEGRDAAGPRGIQSRGSSGAQRARELANVYPTLHPPFSRRGRSRDF